MNAVLIRHTQIVLPGAICYGWFDVPLAPTFEREAASVIASLPFEPDEVHSSPATRCRRLAEAIAGTCRCSSHVEPRLAELHMGEWEGKAWDELAGTAFEAWKADPWNSAAPGGESPSEFMNRIHELRAAVVAEGARNLVLVTHAGVIRAWRSIEENRPLQELFAKPIGFGSIHPVR